MVAAALNTPVSVVSTAGEGGLGWLSRFVYGPSAAANIG